MSPIITVLAPNTPVDADTTDALIVPVTVTSVNPNILPPLPLISPLAVILLLADIEAASPCGP